MSNFAGLELHICDRMRDQNVTIRISILKRRLHTGGQEERNHLNS